MREKIEKLENTMVKKKMMTEIKNELSLYEKKYSMKKDMIKANLKLIEMTRKAQLKEEKNAMKEEEMMEQLEKMEEKMNDEVKNNEMKMLEKVRKYKAKTKWGKTEDGIEETTVAVPSEYKQAQKRRKMGQFL